MEILEDRNLMRIYKNTIEFFNGRERERSGDAIQLSTGDVLTQRSCLLHRATLLPQPYPASLVCFPTVSSSHLSWCHRKQIGLLGGMPVAGFKVRGRREDALTAALGEEQTSLRLQRILVRQKVDAKHRLA
jgi:hypothetical protein